MSENEAYLISYEYTTNKNSCKYSICIFIEFGTYIATEQLYVEIQSADYLVEISPYKDYLSIIKHSVKKILLDDWEKCIWIYDKESEMFALDLYPKIYKAENLLRQLINEVMNKEFGVRWWNDLVPLELHNKKQSRIGSYKSAAPLFANVDETLMVIDVGDLIKIITMKISEWQ